MTTTSALITKSIFRLLHTMLDRGNIRKMRRIATQQGYDANKWFKNVEIVTRKNIGREPVQYVSNINRYFVIYKQLSELQKTRDEHNKTELNPLIFPIEMK